MKIAIIGTAHPFRGGIAHFNERLSKELFDTNNSVKIYNFTVQYPQFLFPGKTQFTNDNKPSELSIERCINSINPINWWIVGKKIKKENYDLVIIPFWLPLMGPSLATIARIIKKKSSSTSILSIAHNVTPHEPRVGDRWFTNYFVKAMDGFVVMTKKVMNDLKSFDPNKTTILTPHPIYDDYGQAINTLTALNQLNLSPDYKYLLFFGLVRDYKGLDLLLKALALVNINNLKLIIAGEFYTDKSIYEDLINELELKDKIIMYDNYIPNSMVASLFSACDMVVQPYKTATQSGVTQIAYHFEKPMVVTDVGGLKEMCPDGQVGYVVKPNETEISKAILAFYNNKAAETMINNIKEIKKKYSWSIFIEKLFSLKDKINNGH